MGINELKSIRQGKHFEVEIDEKDESVAQNKIDEMCKKLLMVLMV